MLVNFLNHSPDMNWAQVVLPLILGLTAICWQNVEAINSELVPFKGNSTGKPGNKTIFDAPAIAENYLYERFACRGKPNGLRLPIADSCMDYYECRNGLAHRLTCKPGMHFSNQGLTCLDARLSKCESEQEPIVSCAGQCCGREDGLYSNKESCSEYVICVDQEDFHRHCGGNLQFSPENLICDIPQRARCSVQIDSEVIDGIVPEDQEQSEEVSKPIMYHVSHRVCRNKPNGYAVGILGSCNKFYLCVENEGYLKTCGKLYFNPEKHYCDSTVRMYCPENEEDDVILDIEEYAPIDAKPMPLPWAKPNKRPLPVESSEAGEPPVLDKDVIENVNKRPLDKRPRPPFFKKEGKDVVPNPSKKLKRPVPRPPIPDDYVEVEEEEVIPGSRPHRRPNVDHKKPLPLPLEEEEEQSDEEDESPIFWPNRVPHKPNKEPEPLIEEEEVEQVAPNASKNICADQPVGALIAMPGDCSKYIRCRWDWYERRVAEVMTCPQEMHFNAKSKYCDWPENAGCSSKKTNPIRKNSKFTKIF